MPPTDEAVNSLIKGLREVSIQNDLLSRLLAYRDFILPGAVGLVLLLVLFGIFQHMRLSRRVKRLLVPMRRLEASIAEQLNAGLNSQRASLEEGRRQIDGMRPELEKFGRALLSLRDQIKDMDGNMRDSFTQLSSSLQSDYSPALEQGSDQVARAISALRKDLERNMSLLDDLLALERAVTKMIGSEKVERLIAKERKLKTDKPASPEDVSVRSKLAADDDDLIPRSRR